MQIINKEHIQLSVIAYKKIIFHCLRYSSNKVYGALISNKSNKSIITNAYPLFHTAVVNPTLCVALDLIESNLGQNQEILGFYQFIEFGGASFNRILQTNSGLNKNMRLLKVWMADQKIKLQISGCELKYCEFESIKKDLLNGEHNLIVDFDSHLQQIELDFNNDYVKSN